jgi:DNA-binding NarL/FixJ family response regulator
MDSIRLLIVDDHPLFRQGLVDVLETDPGLSVVGEAADGATALSVALEQRPDIVLMDANLPDESGLKVTRRILDELPHTRVIILTGYDSAEQIHYAFQLGATAYCAKDIPPDRLLRTIYTIHGGDYVIHDQAMSEAEAAEWIAQRAGRYTLLPDVRSADSIPPLSPREMEILELVTRGASNKEIAFRLNISQQTVKNHMTAVLRKLRVEDRTQAAVYALRQGWVRLDVLR